MSRDALLKRLAIHWRPNQQALQIVLAYLAGGLIYVFVSGQLAHHFAVSLRHLTEMQQGKDLLFLCLTAVLLYWVMRSVLNRVSRESRALLQAREALSELERNSTTGIILRSVIHDLRNQTQIAWGNLKILARSLDPVPEAHRELLHQVDNSMGQLLLMLDQSHYGATCGVARRVNVFDLYTYISDCISLVRHHPKVEPCTVRLASGEPVVFTGFKDAIHDAMTNLVINAAEVLGPGGMILVRVEARPSGATIEVHDSGPGVPQEIRPRVFDPFFTTKQGGTGLGLLTVQACAELHHGVASVGTSLLGGACFKIELGTAAIQPVAPGSGTPAAQAGG